MKAESHSMSAACLEASGPLVQVAVSPPHPLLLVQRALPWEALREVMTRPWRQHGKNIDGRRGWPWEVSLYVPLVVLMLIKAFDSRQREAYLAENAVARVFLGRPHDPQAQRRAHSNIARAYAALGKEGINAVHTWVVKEAHRLGFIDEGVCRPTPRCRSCPLAIPTNRVSCGGWPSAAGGP